MCFFLEGDLSEAPVDIFLATAPFLYFIAKIEENYEENYEAKEASF